MTITTWKTKTFSQDKEEPSFLEGMKSRRRETTTNIEENYETKKLIERMQEIFQKKDPNYKNIEKINSVYENNDNSSGIEDFNKEINDMNAAFDEMSNIFNKPTFNKSEPKDSLSEKENFKQGNKCKRNTELAKFFDTIKNFTASVNNVLFVNFDSYLTQGITVVYDEIEGSKTSGFIDMKNMETYDENMKNMKTSHENMETSHENMENIVEGLKKKQKKKKQKKKKQDNTVNTPTSTTSTTTGTNTSSPSTKSSSINRENDITLIKNQVYYILAIPFALFITYNWFFLMFYKESNVTRVDRTINFDWLNHIKPILHFFFVYLVKATIIFDSIMMDLIPYLVDTIKHNNFFENLLISMLLFIMLFSVIAYVICNHSSTIKNAFFAYLSGSKKPPYVNLLYGIVVICIILSFFPTSIIEYISNTASLITNPIGSFICFIIQLVFTFVNISVAGLLLTLYIFVNSFLGLLIYSNPGSASHKIKSVNEFLYNSIKMIGLKHCPPGSLNWWQRFFKIVIEIIYHCLYESIYILFFFIGFLTYLIHMKSLSCKLAFAGINAFIISAIGIITYYTKIKDVIKKIIESKNS